MWAVRVLITAISAILTEIVAAGILFSQHNAKNVAKQKNAVI